MKLSRRDFSKLVVASSLSPELAPAAGTMPRRPLGKIGFRAGILGLGAQRLSDIPLEQSAVDRLISECLDNGLNYIDTARGYGTSEELLGRALKGKRDKVFLVSKTRSGTRADALKDVEDSLKNLQTDRIDCYHIHNIARDDRYPNLEAALSDQGVLGGLIEAKKQGKIRHIGCTAHLRAPRVLPVFATGQIEVFMCSLNFVERYIYNFEEKVLPEARRRGIAVIAMKVLGGPVNGPKPKIDDPKDYQVSLRYVWGLPEVNVAIIGLRNSDELNQALTAARQFKPLSRTEMASVSGYAQALAREWGPFRGAVS
jgi:aryl-alcohol dehydrogenase-like predicted oxidoreductase